MREKVSAIVPVYNGEKAVSKAKVLAVVIIWLNSRI